MVPSSFVRERKLFSALRNWFPLVVSILVSLGLSRLRTILFPQSQPWMRFTGVALLLALVILGGINIFIHHYYQARSSTKTLLKFRSDIRKRQISMAHSFARQTRRMSALLRYAYYYYIAVMIMVCLVIFCLFDGANEFIIMVYVLWCLSEILFDPVSQSLPAHILSEDAYPLICKTAREAASIAGYRGRIRIFLGDHGIGIFSQGWTENLILGVPEAMLLTREELRQVLIHEFSHVVQADTRHSRRIARALEKWDAEKGSGLTRWGRVFLRIPQDILRRESAYYQSLSDIYREELADAAVANLGDPQQHVNALAKCYAWQLFQQVPRRELVYDLFQPESPREDYYNYLLEAFRSALSKEETHWRAVFAREIPSRFDSHPIFRVRAEKSGITDYNMRTEEPDSAYRREIQVLLQQCNRMIFESSSPEDYSQDRREHYLERKSLIDEAAKIPDWSQVPVAHRLNYAKALACVEPELQKQVLASILQQDPENYYAMWLLGQTLYDEDNASCVELLYRAAQLNRNYIQDAYTQIGTFAMQAGRQDLLDTYMTRVVNQLKISRELNNQLSAIRPGDRLGENDLPADVFSEVRDTIFHRGGTHLAHLYSVKKATMQGPAYFYFLEFSKTAKRPVKDSIFEDIFQYLSQRKEVFSLLSLKPRGKMKRNILRWIPNCEVFR